MLDLMKERTANNGIIPVFQSKQCNQAFTIDKIRKTTNKNGINCLMIPNILQNSRRDTAKSVNYP
jgi:hypothetical protein